MARTPKLGDTPSLKELVYERLRMQIISGELPPGTKLHEEELSAEMGISRAPLREALNMLSRDGFAEIIPRRGAVVSSVSPTDVEDIWCIRLLLEPAAAVMSLPYLERSELEEVRAMLEEVLRTPDNFALYIQSDIRVHGLMIDHLKNPYLANILVNLKDHSLRVRWNAERQSEKTGHDVIIAATLDHIKIVDTMLAGDADAVHDAVAEHIRVSIQRTESCMAPDLQQEIHN